MAAPPPPPQANNTAARQAGGGGAASEYDAAADRRRPDLDVFLKQKGLRIDWGRPHPDRNVAWKQGILHKTAIGSYGAVFRCLPLNPVPGSVDGPQLVVKVNIQEEVKEEEQQPKLKFSTSYMIENAAFTCVPHVAIVRSRARFTWSSSLEEARMSKDVRWMQQKSRPHWLRDKVNHEFLVMDLCEGGDLLCLRPTVQPWYNPFSTLEPPEHRILLQQRLDSLGASNVYVQGLPVGAGYRGTSTDSRGKVLQLPQNVGGFQKDDVLVSVRRWAACEGAADGGQWAEEAVTSVEQAESILQSIVPGTPVASVKVRRSGQLLFDVPVGYGRCNFNAVAVGAVQKQLVHALWLLQSYRIGHFDLKMGEYRCCLRRLRTYLTRGRQRVP